MSLIGWKYLCIGRKSQTLINHTKTENLGLFKNFVQLKLYSVAHTLESDIFQAFLGSNIIYESRISINSK